MMFSIVVPAYNCAKYIEKCISNILVQTFRDFEVIIVNDGSTDETVKIVEKLIIMNSEVTIRLISQSNGGASSARNRGIREAQGNYLIFLDSDDFWLCDTFLLDCYNSLSENRVDMLYFKVSKFDSVNKTYTIIGKDLDAIKYDKSDKVSFLKGLIAYNEFIASSVNKVINREFIIVNDLYFLEGTTGEDIDWIIRVFMVLNTINHINYSYYGYRQNVGGSVTNQSNYKSSSNLQKIINSWYKTLKSKDDPLIKVIMAFLSYHYIILMGLVGKDYSLYEEYNMTELRNLLDYSAHPKVKVIKYLHFIIGPRATCRLLNMYINRGV